jgi:phosphate transport system protein
MAGLGTTLAASLERRVSLMGRMVSARLDAACRGLLDRRLDLLQQVDAGDHVIDGLQREIDHGALQALAVAPCCGAELNLLVSAMRSASELERVGDEAVGLSRSAAELLEQPALPHVPGVRRLAETVQMMLRDAVDGWRLHDTARAEAVHTRGRTARGLTQALSEQLMETMRYDPVFVEPCVTLVIIVQRLGRIAGHAERLVIVLRTAELPSTRAAPASTRRPR